MIYCSFFVNYILLLDISLLFQNFYFNKFKSVSFQLFLVIRRMQYWECNMKYITFFSTNQIEDISACSRRIGDARWWGSLTMVPARNKAKRLSSVNHTTKTIHHHHHHHHHHQSNDDLCRTIILPKPSDDWNINTTKNTHIFLQDIN